MQGLYRFAFAAGLAALPAAPSLAHVLTNSRITLDQADGSQGYSTTNQDRVDAISWIDSSGNSTGNLAAYGGPDTCGDPIEFFGQSYDDGDGAGLYLVISGSMSKWAAPAGGLKGTSTTNAKPTCTGALFSGTAKTTYTLTNEAKLVNTLRIQRKFTFNAQALQENYNLRGYVARFPISTYATVLVPDANGNVQTLNANSCATACAVASWNGKWFADDDGTGRGIAIFRDKSSTHPATVDLDNDSDSESNLTSIVLTLPSGGWTGKVTETEYMCFYDQTSWPAARRNAGKLPKGCDVTTP